MTMPMAMVVMMVMVMGPTRGDAGLVLQSPHAARMQVTRVRTSNLDAGMREELHDCTEVLHSAFGGSG